MIKIYIDENLPHQLAEGLNILEAPNDEGIEVLSIKNVFGKGAKDEDWIPKVGQEGGIVITQDLRIEKSRQQKALYNEHGVGLFFFKPPSKTGYTYWQMVEQIIKRWSDIKRLIKKTRRPFAFRCNSRSENFEAL